MGRKWKCGIELCLGLSLLSVGCGDDKKANDADAGDETSDKDSGQDQPPASPGCGNGKLSAGDTDATLEFGGLSRQYILHVPKDYDASKPTALVINMHGFLSNYKEQAQFTGMSDLADRKNFLVVYPNGAGDPVAWNAGDCCEFKDLKRDDVAFIDALIDAVRDEACVDPQRVYATGHSNGGFLAHEIACKLSDKVAAIASVSGVLGIPPEECKPSRPVPVLQIHGDTDPTVQFTGGAPMGWALLYPGQPAPVFRSVKDTLEFWREKDGCAATTTPGFMKDEAACKSYTGCEHDSAVTLCTITGGGHAWPGGDPSALKAVVLGMPVSSFIGKTSTALDASAQIWAFFEAHPLP
jgi:polyhydroxybutyrate depolymerase